MTKQELIQLWSEYKKTIKSPWSTDQFFNWLESKEKEEARKWKPKRDEHFFVPDISTGKSKVERWLYDDDPNRILVDFLRAGMCYRTEAEAQAAAEYLLKALKEYNQKQS